MGIIKLEGPLALVGSTASVVILTVLALAELVADKLPKTPNRTSPPGLIARIVTGGITGACIASAAGGGVVIGALIGVIGAVTGTFAGYKARTRLVQALGIPDLYVALAEDLIAIGGSLLLVSML